MSHRTYRTRLQLSAPAAQAFEAYAGLFSRVTRTLHAQLERQAKERAAGNLRSFKNDALKQYGLTGRQFNAIQVSLDGQRRAVEECRKLNLSTITDRITRLERAASELKRSLTQGQLNRARTARKALTVKQRARVRFAIHQKSRKLAAQRLRLEALRAQHGRSELSMCFGSRDLFRQQFNLEENGYASHNEWRADWRAARNNQFLVLGSKGETAGCQGCVAQVAPDDTISLRVRLPDALAELHGTHVAVAGLRFAHGHEALLEALARNVARQVLARQVRIEAKQQGRKFSERELAGGAALTYRFVRDAKGWEVLVSVELVAPAIQSQAAAGRVAVDINADHLAVAETDSYGNCVKTFTVPCRTQGLTTDQAAAVIGDAVKAVMLHVQAARKPLVLEKLEFSAKKRALGQEHPAYARMLSSFAYNRIRTLFEARAFDAGIEVFFVDPAFTSVIGRVKYSVPLGITTHEAAAIAIARRAQKVRERAPQPGKHMLVPVKDGVTAWTSPAWMKPQHRAHPWRCVARSLPRPCERASVRTPAVKVSAARKRPRILAGEAELQLVQT